MFLTHKKDSLIVHDYGFKFSQLSRYALKMVKDIISRMCLSVAGLGCASSSDGRSAKMMITWIYQG